MKKVFSFIAKSLFIVLAYSLIILIMLAIIAGCGDKGWLELLG